jgi:hypothetical protein
MVHGSRVHQLQGPIGHTSLAFERGRYCRPFICFAVHPHQCFANEGALHGASMVVQGLIETGNTCCFRKMESAQEAPSADFPFTHGTAMMHPPYTHPTLYSMAYQQQELKRCHCRLSIKAGSPFIAPWSVTRSPRSGDGPFYHSGPASLSWCVLSRCPLT